MTKRAFTFPGQGSQIVGMGRDLADTYPTAIETFQEVDDALKQNLSKIMYRGPEEELRLTENAQPAIMAVSIAVLRIVQQFSKKSLPDMAHFVAGHSLGEYTALCAAGSLTLADTARLLKRRGQAMQAAVPVGEGAMAALIGADMCLAVEIVDIAAGQDVLSTANDNAPGQVVISGHVAAVDRAIALAEERGVTRSIKLPVSAPFHCPLMLPAAKEMEAALADVKMNPPSVPLIANVTTEPVTDPATIRKLLVEQVTGTVRWRESIEGLAARDVGQLVELGSGNVLTGLARRIDKSLKAVALSSPQAIEDFCKSIT